MNIHLFESIPLWGIFLLSIILTLLSFEIGFALGGLRQKVELTMQETMGISIVVMATLGLLILILAFTFSMATTLFEERRSLILDEANAIGTTYLRADFLEEPYRSATQALMREYVSMMLDGLRSGKYEQFIKRFENLQERLWVQADKIAEKEQNSIVAGLFIQSLNDIISVHAKRVMKGGRTLIPETIWFVIYFLAILSFLATGYLLGMFGNGSILLTFILVIAFSSLMVLTADLDRPQEGLFKASDHTMIDIYEQMNAPDTMPS